MSPDEVSLKEWMTLQFADLREEIRELKQSLIGKDRFEAWCNRVALLETENRELRARVHGNERVIFLLKVLVGLLLPVITAVAIALVVALVTGKMELLFR